MSHTDPEILALRALGETAGTARDAEHTQTCPRCRAELTRLTEVVQLARIDGPRDRLEKPPPQVWDRIAAATGATGDPGSAPAGAAVPAGNGATAPARRETPRRRAARTIWPRARLATALASLAAGLIIGVGGAIGVAQLTKPPAIRVTAQVELRPLPAFPQFQDTTGTALMQATPGRRLMSVTLHAPRQPGFYEVWLLARDGVSMISLGDLNADQAGTFTIPPGTNLRNYSRVDVSLQPFNGSTQHSKISVVRGSLPVATLPA